MADTVNDTGNGTPERVAYDLMRFIITAADDVKIDKKDDILDLYNECRFTVRGSRPRKG